MRAIAAFCYQLYYEPTPIDDVPGCTLLTGKDQVKVTLLVEDEKLQETWAVARDNDRYTLVRPNGYLIREPKIIN